MSPLASVQGINQQLARQINDEARKDPNSPYKGKFVGIANGRIVAVGDNLDDVVHHLQQVEADPQKCYSLEAGLDYNEVQDIWSVL
jgi:hypothetical protein